MVRINTLLEQASAAASGIVLALALGWGGPAPSERPQDQAVAPEKPAATMASGPMIRSPFLRPHIPVEVLRVVDGDTVEVRAQIWLDQHITTKVRIRSIDAPERQSRCNEERERAEASRNQLIGLLGSGPTFLTDLGRDKYGSRVLGRLLTANGTDVGTEMISHGHARPYSGGKRHGWCQTMLKSAH